MSEFLRLEKPSIALKNFLAQIPAAELKTESIPTINAMGRICASSVISPESSPGFNRSTVDGYGVHAVDSFGATEGVPAFFKIIGEVRMGEKPDFKVATGEVALIHTGGMLPEGCDAVIMIEQAQTTRENEIEVSKAVSQGENTILAGEDISPGEEIISAGKLIRPVEIGGLLAVGIHQVEVFRKPVVGILSSGDELVEASKTPLPGQIRDINSAMLSALISSHGGIGKVFELMPDDPEKMLAIAEEAFKSCDSLVITAGSSASTRDYTARIIQSLGDPGVIVHGVNIKPGKPTILAVCNGKPVIGLPGNPVSAYVIACLFAIPMLRRITGEIDPLPGIRGKARLKVNLASLAGREDFWPVRIKQIDDEWVAEPIFYKSNLIFTLVNADALAIIPEDANGVEAGSLIDFIPLR
ncbi:MAG: molybdopterin molybdotransferase MoeA [Anaerolineaceae bacterium]|nr:molybdopterin molybdotransferase MoeA [Anaerolineaceae bacterium]